MTRCAAWSGADRGSDGGGYVDLSGVIFHSKYIATKGEAFGSRVRRPEP